MGMEHAKFLTFIQHVFELLPKLLKQSGIIKHFLDKFHNEPWEFEGRWEPMVTNDTKAACRSYSIAFIEHLITRTIIQPPQTLLCAIQLVEYNASVATNKSSVETYASNGQTLIHTATYKSFVAIYISYVATYGSSIATFESHVTTDG
ncbi:hypothetical protein H5410_041081 [Solanum commersonii]|uniref:Uncharacterized protein n=1 Tax=Solanum commersonii TaxID=4109 RepID=A0A9J5XSN2_SOLCO|nr:hypothetical protein H5410_041081 [Solanum commersonii]